MEADLELRCHYDTLLFEDLTVREWLAMLDSIFRNLATDSSQEVLDFAKLTRGDASPALFAGTSSRQAPQAFLASIATSASEMPGRSSDSPVNSILSELALVRALIRSGSVYWRSMISDQRMISSHWAATPSLRPN